MYFNLFINLLYTWKYITCIIYDFQRYPFSTDDNDDHDDEFQNELIRQNDFSIGFNESWPLRNVNDYLGVVSSVKATDQSASNVYVLHRGDRVWDQNTFDDRDNYRLNKSEPIQKGVLVQIFNGEIKRTYFPFKFFLPHGLTIDPDGNFWITDIALHQCIILYVVICLIFLKDSESPGPYDLNIPHQLSLLEEEDAICVADRENKRIVCYIAGLYSTTSDSTGDYLFEYKQPEMRAIYGIAIEPSNLPSQLNQPILSNQTQRIKSISKYQEDFNHEQLERRLWLYHLRFNSEYNY
ncbi:uncharacterized protein DC041_0000473 [Schistosoma bovis]|uniref:Peptidylamidoglycolate lyase n=1 Tax=Schistosoma bovis TaxID=6184 RepID=A0A430QLY8_SCHBO|nr:uncharacterized protein DC041_0000473 [Schistosoma bovis]